MPCLLCAEQNTRSPPGNPKEAAFSQVRVHEGDRRQHGKRVINGFALQACDSMNQPNPDVLPAYGRTADGLEMYCDLYGDESFVLDLV